MSTVRRKKIVSVFAVAILAMTILFGMFLAYADNDTAHALSDVSGAYQIGEKATELSLRRYMTIRKVNSMRICCTSYLQRRRAIRTRQSIA
ncbi:MAG: hypothetical protein OSJ67_05955 [Clostridia bacterium]|nr:hypothetical protein [Clostridia bacterium]